MQHLLVNTMRQAKQNMSRIFSQIIPTTLRGIRRPTGITIRMHLQIVRQVARANLNHRISRRLQLFANGRNISNHDINRIGLYRQRATSLQLRPTRPVILRLQIMVIIRIIRPTRLVPITRRPRRTVNPGRSHHSHRRGLRKHDASNAA